MDKESKRIRVALIVTLSIIVLGALMIIAYGMLQDAMHRTVTNLLPWNWKITYDD